MSDAAAKVERIQEGWAFADFDQISGLAGVIAGLLGKAPPGSFGIVTRALTEGTLRQSGQPPWGTPTALLPESMVNDRYRHGVVNLGLAHGSAGVVAALALALREDAVGAGGERALTIASDTLVSAVRQYDGTPTLPHLLRWGARVLASGRAAAPGATVHRARQGPCRWQVLCCDSRT